MVRSDVVGRFILRRSCDELTRADVSATKGDESGCITDVFPVAVARGFVVAVSGASGESVLHDRKVSVDHFGQREREIIGVHCLRLEVFDDD